MKPDDVLIEQVDNALMGAKDWHDVSKVLRESESSQEQELIRAAIIAFDYMLVNARASEQRERVGVFSPMLEFVDRVYPPSIKTIPDEVVQLWAELVSRLTNPVASSRLNDLLWVRKWKPKPHEYARAAVSSYVALGKGDWIPISRAECLGRALEISLELKDEESAGGILTLMVGAAREAMASKVPIPGVTLRHLEALVRSNNVALANEVDALLDEAIKVYGEDPHLFASIKDLESKWARKDKARQARVIREKAERWKEVALSRQGIQRYVFLQDALEVARLHGFRDMVAVLRGELQKMSPEDLGLTEYRLAIDIPQDALDELLESMSGGGDWRDCLNRFGAFGPPSGSFESNRAFTEKIMKQYPLQFMVERTILDAEGRSIRKVSTEDEHVEARLIQQETQQIHMWGQLAPLCLETIFKTRQRPTAEEATAYFTTDFIDADVAERIGRSLLLYLEGLFDESLHLVIPRLEAVIREICRANGAVIIREPDGSKSGGVVALAELMSVLHGNFDESWRRYLRNLLNEPTGLNLRNRVCHGLLDRGGPREAALALHAACFLRLLKARQPSDAVANSQPAQEGAQP